VIWPIIIVVVPAVFLTGILYLVVRMSSAINKKGKIDKTHFTGGSSYDDGDLSE